MKKQKQKQIKILRILKKLLEVILDGFWEKQPHESLKFPNIEPISEFLIKNRPWFRKQSSKNNKKQELVRVALVKAKIVSELNSQKLEQKANKKKGLTRERVEKYALVWAPQKSTSSSRVVILRICVFFVGFENLGEFSCIFWFSKKNRGFLEGEYPNTRYKTSYRHTVTASIHTHRFRARFCGSHFRLVHNVHTILRSSGLKPSQFSREFQHHLVNKCFKSDD